MTQSNNETLEICSAQEQVRIESKRKRAHVCVCVCLFVQYCIFVTLLIFCCIIFFCAQVVAGMNFFLSFSPNCTDSDIIRYASQTHYNPFFLSLSFFFILSDCSSPRSHSCIVFFLQAKRDHLPLLGRSVQHHGFHGFHKFHGSHGLRGLFAW